MADAIGIAGGIKSGKSSLAKALCLRLNGRYVSFGDQVRYVVQDRGLEVTRINCQQIGEELVASDVTGFCSSVLRQAASDEIPVEDNMIIIDGIRHLNVIQTLRFLLKPSRLWMVFIDTDEETRADRLKANSEGSSLTRLEMHSTECELLQVRGTADLTLLGTHPIDRLVEMVAIWYAQRS